MENVEEIGYRMHYYKVLDTYTQICEKYNCTPSEAAKQCDAIKGSFSVKYFRLKEELKSILKEVVVPTWIEEIPNYFGEKEADDAKTIILATLEFMPEDVYDIFTKSFRTLNMLDAGHIKDVRKFVAKNIKYMSLDEIITNYDFIFQSKFGEELLDGVFEEIKTNPNIAPDVKAYFVAREDGKKKEEKARKNRLKNSRREEPSQDQRQ